MKLVFICFTCLLLINAVHAQGITLLYSGPSGWDDANSWIQMNVPAGQQPISRVPTYEDDVVFSKSLSGYSGFVFSQDVTIGGGAGSLCRSIHVSNMELSFNQYVNPDYAGTVDVYTTNGGFVLADSGSNIRHGVFRLHGGNATVKDLQIIKSKYGDLFTHAVWSQIELYGNAKARFINSTLEGWGFINYDPAGQFYADSCLFTTPYFKMGANTTDTVLNSTIKTGNNFVNLSFFIGKDASFTSSNLKVVGFNDLHVITSGSVLSANVSLQAPGYCFFEQEDAAHPLPNIIDGNVVLGETYFISIKGDFKISGNLIFNTVLEAIVPDTATVFVNGQAAFLAGGLGYLVQHSKLEFFGNTNSNVVWPVGFPVDTLIINKTGCAKVTFQNSLYVTGVARIQQGQLALDANDTLPYKFVCEGDLDIKNGGGVFLRKSGVGVAANMAIQGSIYDQNTMVDSSCTGISNPYNGSITLYRNKENTGNRSLSIASNSSIGNLRLFGRQGSGFSLGSSLTVNDLVLSDAVELLLNEYNLTVTGNIETVSP